ncbi:MAG: serine hydrolase [Planctomycetota bacterium]|nr:serine hydrolase [Planctomycetota bacterium]
MAVCYQPGDAGSGSKPGDSKATLAVSTHWLTVLDPTVRHTPNPSGGLFSTVGDLARFHQMILRGGEFGGKRLLSAASVKLMTQVHTADDVVTGFTPGNAWGLGWCVVKKPQGVSRHLFPGSFGHGGAFGTQVWIDPHRGTIFLLMIQRTKFGNADGSDVRDAFQEQIAMAVRGSQRSGSRFIKYFNYDQAVELTAGKTRVVLCPQAGGRVLEYSLDGRNALYFDDLEKGWQPGKSVPMSAGRFDIGPELVIPQRTVLWSGEWTAEITGPRSARLVSQHDPGTGVQLIRDFTLDESSSRLICKQTIANVSERTVEWCHWSRTFSTGNGICVIPLSSPSRFPKKYVMYEEGSLINFQPNDPHIRERDGFLEITGVPRRPKLGFDTYAGWLAYATRENLLFVKRFNTDSNRVFNEAAGLTISVWYPEGKRVELEPIGPRERLKPGELASFTEEWFLKAFDFPGDQPIDLKKVSAVVRSMRR